MGQVACGGPGSAKDSDSDLRIHFKPRDHDTNIWFSYVCMFTHVLPALVVVV